MKARTTESSRRQFTRQFYRGNHLNFSLALTATLAGTGLNLAISWLLQQTVDLATGTGAALTLPQLVLFTLGLLAVCLVIDAVNAFARPRFLSRAIAQYREYAYSRLLNKNLSAFSAENSALYLSALSNDTASIETNYLQKLFEFTGNALLFAGSLAMMLWYSVPLTAVALVLSALPLVVSLLAGPRLAGAETAVSRENSRFVAALKEGLTGFSVIKGFQAEKEALQLFCKSSRRVRDAKCRRLRYGSILQSVGSLAAATAQLGVFLAGCWMSLSGWGVTPGTMIIFVNLMGCANAFVSALPEYLSNRTACLALMDRLSDALAFHPQQGGHPIPCRLDRGIDLEHLSFGYAPGVPVLQDVSARFAAGKSYAVVGASGSGKSTLLRLLMAGGAYTGSIRYDGAELRGVRTDALYRLVSLVEQNVFVFDSSIRDNITMFRAFPRQEVDRAIQLSGLAPLITAKGEDALCGENGCLLSGGERQRISIARCLLRRTPVLLVDEATAALDRETAFQVSSAILDLEGMTRIVVTHALDAALLRRYDGILVLKNGRVAEQGGFDELMAEKGYFYSLYTVAQ